MARAGILYSHVAAAAAQLAVDGKNPTVDTVRAALGDTGSKSTIAPLLKRWKEERPAEAAAGALSLPPALLEAVRALHERMGAYATARIEDAAVIARGEIASAQAAFRELEAKLGQADADNARLREALIRSEATLSDVSAQDQERALELASVRSDCAGLTMRLADRAAEVAANQEQLRRALSQFEHYQDAAASQRNLEHEAFERRIAGHGHELLRTREHAAHLQRMHAELSGTAAALAERNAGLEEALQGGQVTQAAMQSERDRFKAEAARLGDAHAELSGTLAKTNDELGRVRTALAVRERELVLAEDRRRAAEQELAARVADLLRMARQLPREDREKDTGQA